MKAEYKNLKLPVKIEVRKNMTKLTINIEHDKIIIRHNGAWNDNVIKKIVSSYVQENYNGIMEYLESVKYKNEIKIWGENFTLMEGDNYIDYYNNIIYLTNINSTKLLNQLYKKELMREINNMKSECQEITQVYIDDWRVRKAKKYWGQMTMNKKTKYKYITINLDLIKKPKECLRHTMIHELCHYYVWDHGPEFEELMTKYCPDWREIKERNNL